MFDGITEKELLQKVLKGPIHFSVISASAFYDQSIGKWKVRLITRESGIERERFVEVKRGESKEYNLDILANRLSKHGIQQITLDFTSLYSP